MVSILFVSWFWTIYSPWFEWPIIASSLHDAGTIGFLIAQSSDAVDISLTFIKCERLHSILVALFSLIISSDCSAFFASRWSTLTCKLSKINVKDSWCIHQFKQNNIIILNNRYYMTFIPVTRFELSCLSINVSSAQRHEKHNRQNVSNHFYKTCKPLVQVIYIGIRVACIV